MAVDVSRFHVINPGNGSMPVLGTIPMKRWLVTAIRLLFITIVLCFCGACDETAGLPGSGNGENVVADELIVTLQPGTGADDLNTLLRDDQAAIKDELDELDTYLVDVPPEDRDTIQGKLESSPVVEQVNNNEWIPVEVLPADPEYAKQWHLPAIGTSTAWSLTTGSAEIKVAVLDTGVDAAHPDLQGQLLSGGNTFDGGSWSDVVGHGTAVAGVIAARGDSQQGVASVAWDCPVIPIRVTSESGQATSWSIAMGIALAVQEGARVINISFAPLHHNTVVARQARIAYLEGSLVVIAADNSGEYISGGGSEYALFVGATDQYDNLAGFSTYGEFVDLVAPGVGIHTTQLGNTYGPSSGTSFAAPVVSGVAGLVWSVKPTLQPGTVMGLLRATTRDLGIEGEDPYFGAGIIDAEAAVTWAGNLTESPDLQPPAVSIRQPDDGVVLYQKTTVSVEASDNRDVSQVILTVDGKAIGSDRIAPYRFLIDPAKLSQGQHSLRVVAEDLAGLTSSQTISLTTVAEADLEEPVVTLAKPVDGANVRGLVTVLADAWDNRALARAEILVDGQVVASWSLAEAEAKIAYNWNAADARVAVGPHSLGVRVFDALGNEAMTTVQVVVEKN
jgi:subtilisin family serine protease